MGSSGAVGEYNVSNSSGYCSGMEFEDYFPSMIVRMGAEAFMSELCHGFELLMDCDKGVITFESLKRNSMMLGVEEMRDDDIICMLTEGDLDGDGNLSQMEFCILMFRLSPALLDSQTSRPAATATDFLSVV